MSDTKNILIIEDDGNYAYLISIALRGTNRVTVGSLKEAITHLSSAKWDIVICDLHLPDSDPEHTLREVSIRRGKATLAVITGAVEELPQNCDAAEYKINLGTTDDILAFIRCAERNARNTPDWQRSLNALTEYVDGKLATA